MTTQLQIFGPPVTRKAPHNRRRTSIAAARAAEPELGRLEALTLKILADAGEDGLTNEEISERSQSYGRHMTIPCVCARRNALVYLGLAAIANRTRPSKWGRACDVVVAIRGAK